MGQIRVTPEVLQSAGGAVRQVSRDFQQLSGQVTALRSGVGAAQPSTAQALGALVQHSTRALTGVGAAVDRFAGATTEAGAAYRQADQAAIPVEIAGGVSADAPVDGGRW